MRKSSRVRFHPSSLHNPQAKELTLVSLALEHTEIEGQGLHSLNPEEYFLWIEEQQERASTEGEDYYWD